VEVHLYDPQGNHVGKNSDGGIDMQIPGSEYFERDEDHCKNIVVHNADILSNFTLKVQGTGTGAMDLKVQAPDFSGNMIDSPQYMAVNVNPSLQAELNLTSAKDFDLKMDNNGDGAVDELIAPDSNVQQTVDFTPPSPANDLAVTDVTSGSAVLSFIAPGDDGNQGTAFRYDLRYSTHPITEESWQYATPFGSMPDPQPAGSPETVTVTGLNAGTTYYFAIKARDETLQSSELSNIATATTTIPSLTWSKQRVYWAGLADYQNRQLSVDYKMTNAGTGIAFGATVEASLCNPGLVYAVTQLPSLVGDINPGLYKTVTLKYYVPTNVGSFITTTYANCKDDAGRDYWYPGPLP